jgi:sec-independent protein translocase protein TatA
MPSTQIDSDRLDADLTRVLVLDAELVRREGRTVCLVIRDSRPITPDAPYNGLVEQVPVSAQPCPPPPESPDVWLVPLFALLDVRGVLLGLLALLVIGVVLLAPFYFAPQETVILLVLAVLLFGRRLPEVGRYLGKGIVEFRKGVRGLEDEIASSLSRRATVRYYSRMNPERVYPLLVLITRDLVERVRKKHTDQRTSGPFVVDSDTPVEIEPILPGCAVHPPRVVTRLGQEDLVLTFRVVARVLGKVDGAVVQVRQDHATLAEIDLDVKVVKQTWVALSGLATFLLPALSAVMKHFGLNFETQQEQGFSLYLAVARLVFDHVSPYALTGLLAVVTAGAWWLTRPRQRDVFWDIEKVRAGSLAAGGGRRYDG